ncbi:MAG: DUF6537 domain-containing protein [Pseudomonadota bacterium]
MPTGFKVLAGLQGLRGAPLDPFGRTALRRLERGLIQTYRANIEQRWTSWMQGTSTSRRKWLHSPRGSTASET